MHDVVCNKAAIVWLTRQPQIIDGSEAFHLGRGGWREHVQAIGRMCRSGKTAEIVNKSRRWRSA